MLDAAFGALSSLTDPGLLIMLVIGATAGLIMGLIPGLGGTGAVAILLPVTFGMDPEPALALLIGAWPWSTPPTPSPPSCSGPQGRRRPR